MSEERDIEKIQKLSAKGKTEKIEKYLKDKNIVVVKAAIAALGESKDEASRNILSKLIDNESPEIRKAAIIAFGKGKSEYAKAFIQHLFATEKDEQVKEVAMKVLNEFK